jgi:hypothetical protein
MIRVETIAIAFCTKKRGIGDNFLMSSIRPTTPTKRAGISIELARPTFDKENPPKNKAR